MTDSPASKKIKTTMEQAPDTEWPEAWLMPTGECKDQKAPNKLEPNVSVSAEELKEIGIKWVEQRDDVRYNYYFHYMFNFSPLI